MYISYIIVFLGYFVWWEKVEGGSEKRTKQVELLIWFGGQMIPLLDTDFVTHLPPNLSWQASKTWAGGAHFMTIDHLTCLPAIC